MDTTKFVGIYFDHSPNAASDFIDFQELIDYAQSLEVVSVIWNESDFPVWDKEKLISSIKDNGIGKIVLVGYLPGALKSYFSNTMSRAGNDPLDVTLLSLKEKRIFKQDKLEKAKAHIACACYGVPLTEVIPERKVPVHPDTLVIGGGIAGIQASLEIANGQQKVYLVEKTGTIGGHMAMFDKTFPTLDCAACILTPKMVEVNQHPGIDLMTYSEVKEIRGKPGNYQVKILKKARHIDLTTCIGCGICAEKCPGLAPSEFDYGTKMRKAVYIPFPQAVPNKYLIDSHYCTYMKDPYFVMAFTIKALKKAHAPVEVIEGVEKLKKTEIKTEEKFIQLLHESIGQEATREWKDIIFENSGRCNSCARFCPVDDCIDLNARDEELVIDVGNIIIATGFKLFDAAKATQFGYGTYPNVLTSIEFERLVNAAGPSGGKITRRTKSKRGHPIFTPDEPEPKSVAIIHCVGSRDEHHNRYCSRVCCMYSLKMAHLVKEKLPDAEVYEYYIDMRAFGKDYDQFYQRIRKEGIHMVRGRTARIEESGDQLILFTEDIEGGCVLEQKVDMAILSIGMEASPDTIKLAKLCNIDTDEEGWLKEKHYLSDPVSSTVHGISVAGVCQGPKDIPDTVAQASAAASRVLQNIMSGSITITDDFTLEEIEERLSAYSLANRIR